MNDFDSEQKADILILGAGIIGLTLARELLIRNPRLSILIAEKEPMPALHSSGRNSGVLHAGFYYSPDSLKARFCIDGNRAMKEFCRSHNLALLECGKVVVARNETELDTLATLEKRGRENGAGTKPVSMSELEVIEPNATTFETALYSPETAVVDPIEVCTALAKELKEKGVRFLYSSGYVRRLEEKFVQAGRTKVKYSRLFNCAGLYADRIARDFGFAKNLLIVPFKGVYLANKTQKNLFRTHIYPVPNLANPFLGVHFTNTIDGYTKIGPTAIPAFWRENYSGLERFRLEEFLEIVGVEAGLFLRNNFGFRNLAWREIKKYRKSVLLREASSLVKRFDKRGFSSWARPGIRAQLINLDSKTLVTDFLVKSDNDSVHVLNAVSPAFSSSIPFARWVVDTVGSF